MESHTYVIITTVPRSEFVPNRIGSTIGDTAGPSSLSRHTASTLAPSRSEPVIPDNNFLAPQPFLHALPRTTILHSPSSPEVQTNMLPQSATGHAPRDAQITPTDEIMALDLSASGERTDRPLLFNKDGVVSRFTGSRTTGVDDRGKALDVNVLLETYDWTKTSLGPKDQWPQSLKTVGAYFCIFGNHSDTDAQSQSSCGIPTSAVYGGARTSPSSTTDRTLRICTSIQTYLAPLGLSPGKVCIPLRFSAICKL